MSTQLTSKSAYAKATRKSIDLDIDWGRHRVETDEELRGFFRGMRTDRRTMEAAQMLALVILSYALFLALH